jgi:hypothetical protein
MCRPPEFQHSSKEEKKKEREERKKEREMNQSGQRPETILTGK